MTLATVAESVVPSVTVPSLQSFSVLRIAVDESGECRAEYITWIAPILVVIPEVVVSPGTYSADSVGADPCTRPGS